MYYTRSFWILILLYLVYITWLLVQVLINFAAFSLFLLVVMIRYPIKSSFSKLLLINMLNDGFNALILINYILTFWYSPRAFIQIAKNSWFLLLLLINLFQITWFSVLVPGNIGLPAIISPNIQPTDHISTPYERYTFWKIKESYSKKICTYYWVTWTIYFFSIKKISLIIVKALLLLQKLREVRHNSV